jgi:hypothetical protein
MFQNTSLDNWMTVVLKPDILWLNNFFMCFRILGTPQIASGQRIRLSEPFKSIKIVKEQIQICFKELNMITAGLL